jgi:NAD+ kinase
MASRSPAPNKIAIAAHPTLEIAAELVPEIATFIQEYGLHVAHASLQDERLRARVREGEFDVLIAVGGDGTMLRAGHLCGPHRIPILGINIGRLGFLTEVAHKNWRATLQRVLEGDYWLEERMMLCAEHRRSDQLLGSWQVLNESTIGRGEVVRPVRLITEVDGHYLTTYVADALIVATPTGSTAYALAAGGPILPPELRNILIVPVAPHLSVDRAIVVHEGSWVSVVVRTDHQATLSLDGQAPVPLEDGDQVMVRASEHVVQFIRLQESDYFYRNLTSHMNKNPSAGETG